MDQESAEGYVDDSGRQTTLDAGQENGAISAPKSFRAKTVHFIWRTIPRLFLIGLIAAIVFLFGSINEKKAAMEREKADAKPPEAPLVNTVVMPLLPGTIKDRINLPGAIEAWTTLQLKAEVGGVVEKMVVQEGDHLKKGDLMIQIESDDYRIALDRAKADYALAVAAYNRDKAVHGKGIIPDSQMDIRKTDVELAKAALDNARLMLKRTTIKAPMAGVVNRLDAEVGLLLSVGDPIGEILEINRVKAVVGIPESDVPAVMPLTQVAVTVQALGDRKVVGKKHFLASAPDTTAHLYRLELAVDNKDHLILPGMFIRADVVKQIRENALAIPIYSVITRNDAQFVFLDDGGVARKRPVTLGIMEKWMVEATGGLHAGDRLIVEGHRDVSDGQKINVVHTVTSPDQGAL